MGGGKELQKEDLAVIAALYRCGKSIKEISEESGISNRSVQRWTKYFRETGSNEIPITNKRSGRPRSVPPRTLRLVQREIEKNPRITSKELKKKNPKLLGKVSERTVREYLHRDLEYRRYVSRKKPLLNEKQRSNRLKFCKKYIEWDLERWKTVLWSDEAQFEVTENRRGKVYRRRDSDPNDPKYCQATVKHPDSLVVWGSFGYHGTGSLVVLPKNILMNQHNYRELLNEELEYCFEKTGCDFFMQDGAPCHTVKSVKKWLGECGVRFFDDWPGNSPDLNPIENLWALIKGKLMGRDTSSITRLEAAIRDIWDNLDPAYLAHLAESVPRRLQKCVEAKGEHTKYKWENIGQTRFEDQSSSEQRVNCVQHAERLRKESCTPVKSCELKNKQLGIEPPLGNLEPKEEITEEIDIKIEGEDFCTPLNEEISSSPTKDPLDMISSTCYPSNSPTKDPLEEISSTCFPSSSPTKDPLEVISSTCFPSSSTPKDPLEVISSTCFPSSSLTQDPLEVISSTCFPSTDQLKVDCNDSNTMPVRKTMEMDVDHQLDSHLQTSEGAEDPPQYTRTAKMVGQLLATLSPSAQLKMTVEVMQFIVERLPHYKET